MALSSRIKYRDLGNYCSFDVTVTNRVGSVEFTEVEPTKHSMMPRNADEIRIRLKGEYVYDKDDRRKAVARYNERIESLLGQIDEAKIMIQMITTRDASWIDK